VCPDCRGQLVDGGLEPGAGLRCAGCDRTFPVAGQVPVLLPLDSAFDPQTIAEGVDTYHAHHATESTKVRRLRRQLPGLALDVQSHEADELVNQLLAGLGDGEPVDGLVVGAGFRVAEYTQRFPLARWLITDTEATFGADVVGDVTSLPVADASQDFVLCEHVLEHVLDPLQAAREIERVLRPGGIALIKVPFHFPWHGGFIDFYRFTPAGYLAAFRRMEPVHLGHGPGPASTITYALQSAWVLLFSRRFLRRAAVVVGRLVFGPWRHLDRILVTKQGSLGSGCSLIFIGERTDRFRSPTEVIAEAKALGVAPVLAPSERRRPTP
jgi:SAM-dependent methyltransferase